MKKLFISALALLPLCGTISAQNLIVNMKSGEKTEIPVADIDYMEFTETPKPAEEVPLTAFTDEAFRTAIAEKDLDSNGSLSAEEIAAITELTIRYGTFTSVEGIEHLTALKHLDLMGASKLTSIDVSALKDLEYLHLGFCSELTTVTLGEKKALTELYINYTKVSSIDLDQTGALQYFYASGAPIPSLDFSGNPNIEELSIGAAELTELNMTGLSKLKSLSISDASTLGTQDLTGFPLLESLDFTNLGISKLITTGNPELRTISLNSCASLWKIDVSKSLKLSQLYVYGSYDLEEVWMTEGQVIPRNSGYSDWMIKYVPREYPEDVATTLENEAFRTIMIEVADTDGDGKISEEEAKAVTVFNAPAKNLTDVDFTYFPNIVEVDLSNNDFTTVDLTGAAKITKLNVSNNKLTGLNIALLTELEYLYANNNEIAEMNFSNSSNYVEIDFSYNKLTKANIYYKDNLIKLNLSHNQIEDNGSSTRVDQNKNLEDLDLSYNNIASVITLWSDPALRNLKINNNPIPELDPSMSWRKNLRSIDISDTNLSGEIDLGPASSLESIRAINLPNVTKLLINMNMLYSDVATEKDDHIKMGYSNYE